MTVTSDTNCGCGSATAEKPAAHGRGTIERPRFFARQLVTPDDLTLGQDYFRNKLRRINRYLHGWGVVCGARVTDSKKTWKVVVTPGYILGPYGDEIVIERAICFDLRTPCLTVTSGDPCDDIVDPLCGDQFSDVDRAAKPFYVAVRYKEIPSRPVRVQPVGCGCDDTHCEYSRWRDGYEICVLDACPPSHMGDPPSPDRIGVVQGIPDCPECPTEPWVVLARVETDAKGAVRVIDNCSCRRMVLSLAPYWSRCNDPAITVETAPTPAPPAPAPGGPAPGGPIR